jgi:hypothetical protein
MCDCIEIVNAALQPKHLKLVLDKELYKTPSMTIGIERTNGPIKFDHRLVAASYCPICGERYELK